MNTSKTKLSIIGAGIAGCAVATHLARLGYQVIVHEKEKTKHNKVCGEFLSPEAVEYLEELGINVKDLGASTIESFHFYSKNFSTSFDFDKPAYGISRYLIDDLLMQKAQELGVEFITGSHVKNYSDLDTEHIFLATGKYDLNSEESRTGTSKSLIGLKMYYKLKPEMASQQKKCIDLFSFQGGYAGMSFVEDDKTNVSFLIDKEIYKKLGSFNKAIEYICQKNPKFAEIIDSAEELLEQALSISNLPYGFIYKEPKESPKNIYRLGDQFAVIPSFAGSGMSIALYTAKQAAFNFHNSQATGLKQYNQQCRKELKSIINFGYIIHSMMQNKIMAEIAVMFAGICPAIAKSIMQQTRITYK